MDIGLKTDDKSFKFRVAGCLVKDNSLLGVQMCHNGFYCFPGGHLHVGEDSISAIKREFKEEVLVDCKVEKLFAVMENFFKNKKGVLVHEVCFFYLLSADVERKDYNRVENDEGELKDLEFKWFDLDKLDKVDFRPDRIKEKLQKKDFSFEHIIYDQTK